LIVELFSVQVWISAASQNFNSIGIGFGSLIAFASYNQYQNSILKDTMTVATVNALTSVLAGIIVFATLGNLSHEQGKCIDDIVSDGPGLVFVVYPQALNKMPLPTLWASLFFFMLLCLGLDSQVRS
jgi:solute carrier family 6 GABA transporter-like protein 6/8/11/12/13